MLRIFPDRVEMGFWRIWRNYALMILVGFITGLVFASAVHMRTDWLDQLRTILGGG